MIKFANSQYSDKYELLKVAKPIILDVDTTRIFINSIKTNHSILYRIEGEFSDNQPRYNIGDVLYVKEGWGNYSYDNPNSNACYFIYRADFPDMTTTYIHPEKDEFGNKIVCNLPKWRSQVYMPKEAARIFLIVKKVRKDFNYNFWVYELEGIMLDYENYNINIRIEVFNDLISS